MNSISSPIPRRPSRARLVALIGMTCVSAGLALFGGCNISPSKSMSQAPGAPLPYTNIPNTRTVDSNAFQVSDCSLAVVMSTATSGLGVNKKVPAVTYIASNGTTLYYSDSYDEYGSGWRARQEVAAVAGDDRITECCLIDGGGAPAVAYVVSTHASDHSPYAVVYFARYYALDGWTRYQAAGDDPNAAETLPGGHGELLHPEPSRAILGLSAAIIDGDPAISYYRTGSQASTPLSSLPYALRYVRAKDSTGRNWGDLDPHEIVNSPASQRPFTFMRVSTSLVEVTITVLGVSIKRPLVAFFSGDDLGLAWPTGHQLVDINGPYDEWKWQYVVSDQDNDALATGAFVSLALVDVIVERYPAMSYRNRNNELGYIRATAKAADGSFQWSAPFAFPGTQARATALAVVDGKPVISCCLDAPTQAVMHVTSKNGGGSAWNSLQTLADVPEVTPVSMAVVKGRTAIAYFDGGLKYVRYPSY